MKSTWSRREILRGGAIGLAGAFAVPEVLPAHEGRRAAARNLRIKNLAVTPIALPDPPILAAGGCHGPYFLRNIVEIETDEGVSGIGETHGGDKVAAELNRCRDIVRGRSALSVRSLLEPLREFSTATYAGIELACLDAIGRATGLRICDLLGGPVREEVEFAAYLFYRFAADHPRVLDDPRLVDDRGRGDRALDDWGEVRTPEAMVEMAERFRRRWGFRVLKLKAGVLEPEQELRTLQLMHERFGDQVPLRIDPNGRWQVGTAVQIGRHLRDLPLEYYEDPVAGMNAMADVRSQTGLTMSTNACVSRFEHVREGIARQPIDVVLGDHHWFEGLGGYQTLGRICQAVGWGLSMHSNNHAGITMAAMIHVGAATPQLAYAADTHYVWLVDGADIITGAKLPIREGKMSIPTGPGTGVTLDRDKLARAHETYRKCGMRQRDDAFTMRRFIPGWQRTLY